MAFDPLWGKVVSVCVCGYLISNQIEVVYEPGRSFDYIIRVWGVIASRRAFCSALVISPFLFRSVTGC